MQRFVTADKSMIKYILHKVEGKTQRYKRRNQLHLRKEKIYIILEGAFVRKVGNGKQTGVEFLDDSTVLLEYFYRATDSEFYALTTSEVMELDANTVIDILEEGNFLSALLFYITEQHFIHGNYFERQFEFPCRVRVALFIKEVGHKFGKLSEEGVLLPAFLTIQLISSYCCCSRGSVSEALNFLQEQGILSSYQNRWYIRDMKNFQQLIGSKISVSL